MFPPQAEKACHELQTPEKTLPVTGWLASHHITAALFLLCGHVLFLLFVVVVVGTMLTRLDGRIPPRYTGWLP